MGLNKVVNFFIAKLLKEKGFDKYCNSGYTETGGVYLHQGGQEPIKNGHGYYEGRNYNGGEFYCSAPTIAEVVCWIYNKYQIWIQVSVEMYEDGNNFLWQAINLRNPIMSSGLYGDNGEYSNPTEAYEAAIEYILI